MNTIVAKLNPSKYVNSPHLDFFVDGRVLSDLLSEQCPDQNIAGMIPTTLNWLESESEQLLTWNRFLDRNSPRLTIPLLCCPDDLDFSCSLLMVVAVFDDDVVRWTEFGFDTTDFTDLPARVGSRIEPLPTTITFSFDRSEYDIMTNKFETWSLGQITG